MEKTSRHHRPLLITAVTGYFIILWCLMLWTTLYLGITGKQSVVFLFTNLRWLNLRIFSLAGLLILIANIIAIVSIYRMRKRGVYLLLAVIIATIAINFYAAPSAIFDHTGMIVKLGADLIALYLFVPIVALFVGFKYLSWMK